MWNSKVFPKSIYIHWPFCISKCDYCDFLSFSNKKNFQADRYMGIGDVYAEYKNDYANAIKYYKKALELTSIQQLKEDIEKRLKKIESDLYKNNEE